MAMKYVKNLAKSTFYMAPLVLLFGCGSVAVKDSINSEDVAPKLRSTLEFVPVIEKDKSGVELPYQAQVNPYVAQSGRIKKESVLAFIDARKHLQADKLDLAKGELEALLENEHSLSGPWVLLGDIAHKKGNDKQAVRQYRQALAVNPDNLNAYLKLALVQRQLGRYIEAQNTYAQALTVWPDFPEAHLNLAILYDIYLNHPIRAQKHMEAYQFLTAGDNPEAGKWLAEIQSRTGIAIALKPLIANQDSANEKPGG